MLEWWQVVAAMISAVGLREVVAKLIDRENDKAERLKVNSEIRKDDVQVLRDVLVEVTRDSAEKSARLEILEERLDKLEERERHQLTRAAVHEAWDQMAFAMLTQHHPNHPPPPPLTTRELMAQQEEATK